ncbi:proteinase inhibitor PSI-1.2-like [Miscanthus floridulus]|uniref:proteinase inhibitor PSI-1.2-like n=1 Tax=Miscanthus floridulus TaxID=154761 RepID=UPI003458FA89
MAASRFYVTCALLLIGVVLLGQQGQEGIEGTVACPQYCLEVDYVTCPSSGSEKLPARCNCCLAPKGCTLHLSDGTQQTCS